MKTFFLCLFLCVAVISAAPQAYEGSNCNANMTKIYPEADGLTLDGTATYNVRAFAVDSNNARGPLLMNQGECNNWGADNNEKIHYLKWAPTDDVTAIVELTNANSFVNWVTKMMIVSQAPGTADCSKMFGALQIGRDWTCEAYVTDFCQNYPNDPDPITFKKGREYIIILDTPTASATNFTISIIKQVVLFSEGFDSIASGNLPLGWFIESYATFRSWRVDTVANHVSPQINFSTVDEAPVGGVGTKILALNPFNNPPLLASNCSAEGYVRCNHTRDAVTTSSFNLTGVSSALLSFETYFFNGYTPLSTQIQIKGTIEATIDNGTSWIHVLDMPSVFATFWYVESVALPAAVAGADNVRLRFIYEALRLDPQFGWMLNNIQVTPSNDYDMCEDGYSCTYHTCSTADFGCVAVDNDAVCTALSVECVNSVCQTSDVNADATSGCVFTEINNYCDDNLDCTEDGCDLSAGCYNNERNTECEDNKGCTVNYCFNRDNENFALANGDGCAFIQQCDDEVFCTVDTCENVTTGGDKCLHTVNFQYCDDLIDCTYELTCDAEQAGFDGNKTGCIRIPMHDWCDDNDPCTIDSCDQTLGLPNSCVNTNVTCDDCLDCTTDYCVDGDCQHDEQHDQCDDSFDCTVDICDKSLGKCTNNPNDTYCGYFGDPCSIHYCRPWAASDGSGCVSFPKVCDDEIACTEDSCDELTGDCVFTSNDTKCDDDLECTDDTCNANIGKCTNIPNSANCNSGNPCLIDFCSMNGTCDTYPMDCDDTVLCSDDYCVDGVCQHFFNNTRCHDDYDCTMDICDENLGKCTNDHSDAYCSSIGSPCDIHFCNPLSSTDPSGCYSVEKDCTDTLACTADLCEPTTGECYWAANDTLCDDDHMCTVDVCDEVLGRCTNFADNERCDDSDVCTEKDICGADGECHYVDLYCNDQIWCTDDTCDSLTVNGCVFTANDTLCDDGNDCTEDYCDVEIGRCANIPVHSNCPGRSECESGKCSLEAKGCVYESHDDWCDDLVGCTVDVCNGAAGCSRTPHNSLCDDGIGCTEDKCEADGCDYDRHDSWCEDGLECTENICTDTEDCIVILHHSRCDDGINCTRDVCDKTMDCQNPAVHTRCSDGIGCTVDICDPNDEGPDGDHCIRTAYDSLCEDGFECSDSVCDYDVGCVSNYTTCPWYELGHDDKICIECMSSSGQIDQLHYHDGTGAMSFKTKDDNGELIPNMVLLPSRQVIIGNADQSSTPVSTSDGLVINDAFRIVPLPRGNELPECNEIRRGTFIVEEVEEECGLGVCHKDIVKVCRKEQDYQWVALQEQADS